MRQFITIYQNLIPIEEEKQEGWVSRSSVVDGLWMTQGQFQLFLSILGHPMTKTGKIYFGGWDQFTEEWEHGGFQYSVSVHL